MKTNTLGAEQNFKHIITPESETELQEIIKKCIDNNTSFSAVSTGNNWGYGCKNPHSDVDCLIEMSKMNNVLDFDKINGLVTLQPGVTYGDLYNFLKNNGNSWIAPVHGGGPDCSVIGNALERGYGLTPITNHFSACQSLKAILPDGSIYESPLKSMGLDKLSKLFKYGVGPYLDGIFTQSNFGIISQMTIKLAPSPKSIELFFIELSNDELEKGFRSIKTIKQKLGNLVGGINIMNRERVLSMMMEYPSEKIRLREMISKEEINQFAIDNDIAPWSIVGSISGEKETVNVAKKLIRKYAKELSGKKIFLNNQKIDIISLCTKVLPNFITKKFETKLESVKGLISILQGVPKSTALKLAYWKNLQEPIGNKLNPTDDNCGLIWYAPLVEMSPNKCLEYVDFINSASSKFGINPLITLTTVDDLCFDSTIPIVFNKEDIKDQERAHAYFDYLISEGFKKGFYPYRLGTNSMHHFQSKLGDDYLNILTNLKMVFDNKNLFSLGRYIPIKKKAVKNNLTAV